MPQDALDDFHRRLVDQRHDAHLVMTLGCHRDTAADQLPRLVGSCLISSRHARDEIRRGLSARFSMISIAALTFALRPCSAAAADLRAASSCASSARYLR